MQQWYEVFNFERDPYQKIDPYKINDRYFIWNRSDLKTTRNKLDDFIEDTINQKRVGLGIFGPFGSGKTWLTRIIEIELLRKNENILFIYTKIPRIEPSFKVVYHIAIKYFLENYFKKLENFVSEKSGNIKRDSWYNILKDEDLAKCFNNYANNKKPLASKWLTGEKMSAAELNDLEIISSLDSDYDRLEVLEKLIESLSEVFFTTVFVIDELENASIKFADELSDSLRDLLDSFSERFALVASFTAQKWDEWYEIGYTEGLGSRFDFIVNFDSLKKNHLKEFMRLHNQAYRKKDKKIDDQLQPFTNNGIMALLESMRPQFHYPRYFFSNCQYLARLAAKKKIMKIDETFVKGNTNEMPVK